MPGIEGRTEAISREGGRANAAGIPLSAEKVLGWLEEVGRRRALTDSETDIIEAIVLMQIANGAPPQIEDGE